MTTNNTAYDIGMPAVAMQTDLLSKTTELQNKIDESSKIINERIEKLNPYYVPPDLSERIRNIQFNVDGVTYVWVSQKNNFHSFSSEICISSLELDFK